MFTLSYIKLCSRKMGYQAVTVTMCYMNIMYIIIYCVWKNPKPVQFRYSFVSDYDNEY